MPLLPRTLQPSFIIRRKAMRQGVLGRSIFWKLVAGVVFGSSALRKAFGRTPEPLGRRTIRAGHVISVATSAPVGRRQAKRAGITKDALEAQAWAELDAARKPS
ncbi:MAG TPA: hypothetical protein VK853_03895 [Ilumatobacteraceae bacterium]|nr:hypothetical protein [Ilumatobacteraceae bacterium]